MDRKDASGYGNQILYRMCEEQPRHTNADITAGKVWLIGRAYAAAIERRAGAMGSEAREQNKDLHDFIAPEIGNSGLDDWLESVAAVRSVNLENLPLVLAVHFRFVDLLNRLTGLNRRSFASKYLHFHQPSAFFIYDDRANTEIRRRIGRCITKVPSGCAEYDEQYAGFVLRCVRYRDERASRSGETPMRPRQLDRELLGY